MGCGKACSEFPKQEQNEANARMRTCHKAILARAEPSRYVIQGLRKNSGAKCRKFDALEPQGNF